MTKYSADQKNRVCGLYQQELSIAEIARRVKMPYQATYKTLERRGLIDPTRRHPRSRRYTIRSAASIYQFVGTFKQACGMNPTYQEIANALNISYTAAQDTVRRLVKQGYLRITPGRQRSIRQTGKPFKPD